MKRLLTGLLVTLFLFTPGGAMAAQLANPHVDYSSLTAVDASGHWAEREIQNALDQRLMVGTGKTADGRAIFSPEAVVSRAQLAAVLVRTFNLDYGDKRFIKQPLATDYYRDVDNAAWYADALVMCSVNEIFAGDSDKFQPNRGVPRIEVAWALQSCFAAKGIDVVMIMMMPEYNDMKGLSQEETNALVFASNTGIMKGDGDNNFRPRQAVKRAELARILNRCTSMMSVDQSYNNKEYSLKAGQSFTLSLPGNPSTGYTWTLAEPGDKNLLKLTAEGFQAGADSRLVGQAGTYWWKFTAIKAGTTKIKLVYARPWESVQPAQTFEVIVVVK